MWGELTIRTLNSSGTAPGGSFVNPAGGGITAPSAGTVAELPQVEWDTFLTLGLAVVPEAVIDETYVSAGFSIPSVSEVTGFGYMHGVVQNSPQSQAGNGTVLSPNLWGVLIMQLTVNAGNHVAGTVAVSWGNTFESGTIFVVEQQTFNSFPAPGTLAALGLAAICGSKRWRRNSCNTTARGL